MAQGFPAFRAFQIPRGDSIRNPPTQVYSAVPPDAREAYIQRWNFTIQRQLPKNFTRDVAYVGNHGVGVKSTFHVNAGVLTGKYSRDRDALPPGGRFHVIPGHADIRLGERNCQITANLQRLAASTGLPDSRLALSRVFRTRDIDTVPVGARTRAHLDNALAAVETHFEGSWMEQL